VRIYDSHSFILQSDIDLEGYPYYALEDQAGNVYATYSNDGFFAEGKVSVFNRAKQKMAEGNTGKMPTTICIAEEEGRVFVANTGNKSVDIFEKNTLKKIKRMETDYMPDDIIYGDGAIYITCMMDNSLLKADTDGKIIKKIYTRNEPRGLMLI